MIKGRSFGWALSAMKKGEEVCRASCRGNALSLSMSPSGRMTIMCRPFYETKPGAGYHAYLGHADMLAEDWYPYPMPKENYDVTMPVQDAQQHAAAPMPGTTGGSTTEPVTAGSDGPGVLVGCGEGASATA